MVHHFKSILPFLLFIIIIFQSHGQQTIHPGDSWPDDQGNHINAHGGGILYHDNTYYWYGEHKGSRNNAYVGITCYSSTDLYSWKFEGVVLPVSTDETSEIVAGCVMERPKVVYNVNTDEFVMWFHLELKGQGYSAARTALAVASTPIGPFQYQKSFRPNAGQWPMDFPDEWKQDIPDQENLQWWSEEWYQAVEQGLFVRRDFEKGQMSRDMTVFVDDDGSAYHIHSAEENLTLHISELKEDYKDFTGRYITLAPAGHNEAPAVFKHEGFYYMITSGCTGWNPNAARSFRAKSMFGPWEPLGNPCVGEGADLTFKSQSTFVLPLSGNEDVFLFMADRWTPKTPGDGRYVWLPLKIEDKKPVLEWFEQWSLEEISGSSGN